MSNYNKLLFPLVAQGIHLKNRVVMAPMNRRRAINGVPGKNAIEYFSQRAGAGLIITDNTAVANNGFGYLHTPGIYNNAQKQGWKKVVDAVHAKGGTIIMQLVHTGRIGHPLNHENQAPLVAPSAIAATGTIRTLHEGHLPMPAPELLSIGGIHELIEAHIRAAKTAIEIGFDGVEIHGAHGFLAEQFLHPHTNQRMDEFGGSIANRSRFLLNILEAVAGAIGKEKTGVRLSPFAGINDLPPYAEEAGTYRYLADALKKLDILYIHLSQVVVDGHSSIPTRYIKELRSRFPNLLMLAGGYTAGTAEAAIKSNEADLIAFGKPFISNPDLVERFRRHAPLTEWDETSFYEGGDKGYIDYPGMKQNNEACCQAG
jgi:N-ethylmaleimide reductase